MTAWNKSSEFTRDHQRMNFEPRSAHKYANKVDLCIRNCIIICIYVGCSSFDKWPLALLRDIRNEHPHTNSHDLSNLSDTSWCRLQQKCCGLSRGESLCVITEQNVYYPSFTTINSTVSLESVLYFAVSNSDCHYTVHIDAYRFRAWIISIIHYTVTQQQQRCSPARIVPNSHSSEVNALIRSQWRMSPVL